MKKIMIITILSIFLLSSVIAIGIISFNKEVDYPSPYESWKYEDYETDTEIRRCLFTTENKTLIVCSTWYDKIIYHYNPIAQIEFEREITNEELSKLLDKWEEEQMTELKRNQDKREKEFVIVKEGSTTKKK